MYVDPLVIWVVAQKTEDRLQITTAYNNKLFASTPPIMQMHAKHHRRPLGISGGLPLWPWGDATGGEREPTTLPRRLCPEWLGTLEPLQPGETRTQIRTYNSISVYIQKLQTCVKPSYFFHSERLMEFKAEDAVCYSELTPCTVYLCMREEVHMCVWMDKGFFSGWFLSMKEEVKKWDIYALHTERQSLCSTSPI